MKYCGKCGAPLNDNQSVCMKCGCPVTSQGSQAAKAETQGLNDKQKKNNRICFHSSYHCFGGHVYY